MFTQVRGRSGVGGRGERGAKDGAVVWPKWLEEDEALGLAMRAAVVAVISAAAGRFTETEPARGAIAGAEEAVGIDEGFNRDRFVRIARAPVSGDAAGDLTQQAGSQKAHLDPGQDKEGRLADDQTEFGSFGVLRL